MKEELRLWEDWEGAVEVAETVMAQPLSVRIARCLVVRRGHSAVVKVPRNQVVLVDPEGLPGVYMARIVATLKNCNIMSTSNARSSAPLVGKSPLVVSPQKKLVASSDISAFVASSDDGILKVGSGECLPELPKGGLPVAANNHRDDLQAEDSSPPVENRFGNQVDTTYK
jgi:hypothetical protein